MSKEGLSAVQQEVVGRLHAAAIDAQESSLINLLYEMEEGSVRDFFIDVTRGNENDEDQSAPAKSIDNLCEALGIDLKKWSKSFISGETRAFLDRPIDIAATRMAQREGMTVGQYVTGLAFDTLPIELEDEGSGGVTISLQCGVEHVLHLHSHGEFWTNYPPEDSDEDSELEWEITYEADVLPRGL